MHRAIHIQRAGLYDLVLEAGAGDEGLYYVGYLELATADTGDWHGVAVARCGA
jgi:hypothetical protein